MACRRCSICSRNHPTSVYVCPGCGEKTWFDKSDDPDLPEDDMGNGERDNALAQGTVGTDERFITSNKVIDWRYEVLAKAGYSSAKAMVMSFRSDIDLHLACELLANGCDPEMACEILL